MRRSVVAALALVLLLLSAQRGGASPAVPDDQPGSAARASYEHLSAVAESSGDVGVILELADAVVPEGNLGSGDVEQQRRSTAAAVDSFLGELGDDGVQVSHRFDSFAGVALRLDSDAVARLGQLDRLITKLVEDDALEPTLADGPALMAAPVIWDLGWTGSESTIAIVDSGVDPVFAELGDGQSGNRLVAEACFSYECPNGETEMIGEGASAPLPPEYQKWEHGSLMAMLAAGATGSPGVAPSADVVGVRLAAPVEDCGEPDDPQKCSVMSSSGLVAALDWLVGQVDELEIDAVNLALGGAVHTAACPESIFASAIEHLESLGVAVVAAAGNGGNKDAVNEVACVPGTVVVGSTSGDTPMSLEVAPSSNSSELVDLWGPSNGLLFGTSTAAAHLSGAVALLVDAFPDAMPVEVAEVLRATGFDLEDVNGIVRPFPELGAAYDLLARIYGRVCVPNPSAGVVCDLAEPEPADAPPEICPLGYTIISVDPQDGLVEGTGCADFIIGTDGPDQINGRGGDDFILGRGGDDVIEGWTGDDVIHAGDGDDRVWGNWGRDRIFGDAGTDEIWAGDHNDEVSGGEGDDVIDGGWGGDELFGNAGDDEIDGGHSGGDEINGGGGDDTLYGGVDFGNDAIFGGSGDDVILGEAGNDHLEGNRGADLVWAAAGTDTVNLVDGANGVDLPANEDGPDKAWGGDDEDLVWFHPADLVYGFEHEYPA